MAIQPETDGQYRVYYRSLIDLDEGDFVEACDRILYLDDWFPSIARIRSMAEECGTDRRRRERQARGNEPVLSLVCPTCHGARWVMRTAGYDPPNVRAGETGSRAGRCPSCCDRDGVYIEGMERAAIRNYGGVPNPDGGPKVIDRDAITWPQRMDELRDPHTGRIDMEALYRLSREMRGLDPTIDERPGAVRGFRTLATTF